MHGESGFTQELIILTTCATCGGIVRVIACIEDSLSEKSIRELLPLKRDRAALVALMAQVESKTQQHAQLNYLKDNLTTAGVAVLKVLKYFIYRLYLDDGR